MTDTSDRQTGRSRFLTVGLPLYLWAVAMLTVSSIPGQKLPEIGLWQWDKLAHVFEFAVFAFLLYRYLYSAGRFPAIRIWWLCLTIGTVYGAADELHQFLVPMRTCTWQDHAADSLGVVLGTMAGAKRFGRKGAS